MEYFQDIDGLRRREFGHAADVAYLDHAGATLYRCVNLVFSVQI